MKQSVVVFLMFATSAIAMDQAQFDEMDAKLVAGELAPVETFLEENRDLYAKDPEYYVLLLNYALEKGIREEIVIEKDTPGEGLFKLQSSESGEEGFDMVDAESGKKGGNMSSRLHVDRDLLLTAIRRTQQAQTAFKERLDVHFGIVSVAYRIEELEIMGEQLVDILKTSKAIEHQWRWGPINTMEGDPKDFMLENVQNWVSRLFRMESEEADKVMRNVSETLISEFPDVVYGHANLGGLALMERDFDTAEKHYNAVLRIDPEDNVALKNMEIVKELRAEAEKQQK